MEYKRENPPHGTCEDVSFEENKRKNLWSSRFSWLNYTLQVSFLQVTGVLACEWGMNGGPQSRMKKIKERIWSLKTL